MWLFDIYYDIYSREMNRSIFVVEWEKGKCDSNPNPRFKRRRYDKPIYIVVEEWHTPESQGDTGDWDFYTFMTYQDAAIFIAELCMKFNSPAQQRLMEAAEQLVTDITKENKKAFKKMEADQRQKQIEEQRKLKEQKKIEEQRKIEEQKRIEQAHNKHVYAFDMNNGTVKIGVSNNVSKRRAAVSSSSGLEIPRWCYTETFRDYRAYGIESECHKFFAPRRTKGEFFKISYEEARDKLQTYGKIFEETA